MADCYDDYFNDTQNLDPTGEAEDAAAEVIGKIPEPTELDHKLVSKLQNILGRGNPAGTAAGASKPPIDISTARTMVDKTMFLAIKCVVEWVVDGARKKANQAGSDIPVVVKQYLQKGTPLGTTLVFGQGTANGLDLMTTPPESESARPSLLKLNEMVSYDGDDAKKTEAGHIARAILRLRSLSHQIVLALLVRPPAGKGQFCLCSQKMREILASEFRTQNYTLGHGNALEVFGMPSRSHGLNVAFAMDVIHRELIYTPPGTRDFMAFCMACRNAPGANGNRPGRSNTTYAWLNRMTRLAVNINRAILPGGIFQVRDFEIGAMDAPRVAAGTPMRAGTTPAPAAAGGEGAAEDQTDRDEMLEEPKGGFPLRLLFDMCFRQCSRPEQMWMQESLRSLHKIDVADLSGARRTAQVGPLASAS